MRCDACGGRGWILRPAPIKTAPELRGVVMWKDPCDDCGGSGICHCCDGLTAANDTPPGSPGTRTEE